MASLSQDWFQHGMDPDHDPVTFPQTQFTWLWMGLGIRQPLPTWNGKDDWMSGNRCEVILLTLQPFQLLCEAAIWLKGKVHTSSHWYSIFSTHSVNVACASYCPVSLLACVYSFCVHYKDQHVCMVCTVHMWQAHAASGSQYILICSSGQAGVADNLDFSKPWSFPVNRWSIWICQPRNGPLLFYEYLPPHHGHPVLWQCFVAIDSWLST